MSMMRRNNKGSKKKTWQPTSDSKGKEKENPSK